MRMRDLGKIFQLLGTGRLSVWEEDKVVFEDGFVW